MDEKIITDLADQVKGVADDLGELKAKEPEVTKADLDAARDELNELKASAVTGDALERVERNLAEFKATLRDGLGKSGADDWREEWTGFLRAVYHEQKNLKRPAWLTKVAADYVTDVDAQGGYLVPRGVADEITKLTLRHGQVWPEVTKFTMPPGMQLRVPWESTLASVAIRTAQGGTATEIDPAVVFGGDTLALAWYNGYGKIANEAMTAPGISLPDTITMQLYEQLVRKIEESIIDGDTGGDDPHDGILNATSVNTQTTMATVTMALLDTYIGECLADHEGSGDTSENYLVTTDAVRHQLMTGFTETGIGWGDPANPPQTLFRGYRLITSPHAFSTTHRMIMAPLRKIKVGWSGQFAVSFNESLGWVSNETWVRVSTHADFSLGNPDMYHQAPYTALA